MADLVTKRARYLKVKIQPCADLLIRSPNVYTWYKDEGRKDKCIQALVHLVDAETKEVICPVGQRIDLEIELYYDGPKRYRVITSEEILTIIPENSRLFIEGSMPAKICFRITAVSKIHQGQNFCLCVRANLQYPESVSMENAFSESIEVKSKRRKHVRQKKDVLVSHVSPQDNFIGSSMGKFRERSFSITNHADIGELSTSLREVVQWAEDVASSLEDLRWKPLSYEGSSDEKGELLCQMKNPNETIKKLLDKVHILDFLYMNTRACKNNDKYYIC